MPGPLDLIKAFQTSKFALYFDGDPQEYAAEVTVPKMSHPSEAFNNTSTGGEVEVADPFRCAPDGPGSIKFDSESAGILGKVMDSTKVTAMTLAMAQNALNPQLGQFLPLPVSYKIGAQFRDFDPGTIIAGTKRELTAEFNMFSYKVEINLITVIDFDFINATFKIGATDLLSAVQGIL